LIEFSKVIYLQGPLRYKTLVFGTPLEQRFTRAQIEAMLSVAGFAETRFSSSAPYWCAAAIKA
jgi:hypothetical protein